MEIYTVPSGGAMGVAGGGSCPPYGFRFFFFVFFFWGGACQLSGQSWPW